MRPVVFTIVCLSSALAAAADSPLLVRSSLAPASTVFVREFPERNDRFVEQLGEVCEAAGVELHVVPAGEPYAYNHIWLQDATELLERADGSGTVALFANRSRAIDQFAADRMPGVEPLRVGEHRPDFARGEGGDSWIDWYGNLEASPPTEAWPNGRVLYGVNPDTGAQMHPSVVQFLDEQGRQSPLALDVGWLAIRHVDEMVSFLPASDGGFYVALPNPLVAVSLLKRLERAGHGGAELFGHYEEGVTVAGLLADKAIVAANVKLFLERIEPMGAALLEGIGVDESRLIYLPVLFNDGGTPRTPNVVNALVLPGAGGKSGHVAMSDPNGPIIDGSDAWQDEVRKRLGAVDAEIHFVDDRQYHKWSGNVHCATNALRPLAKPAD